MTREARHGGLEWRPEVPAPATWAQGALVGMCTVQMHMRCSVRTRLLATRVLGSAHYMHMYCTCM